VSTLSTCGSACAERLLHRSHTVQQQSISHALLRVCRRVADGGGKMKRAKLYSSNREHSKTFSVSVIVVIKVRCCHLHTLYVVVFVQLF